ncbi:hypothetical protein AMJ83_11685 [candidate division WOR_3 bacterium SM23_42]|uniref:Uncharacterized protein n=1 Tax=candidate division WOR_3 bacterium SM23_42 TaxID=1703779 RepID=A0A0S8FNE2_UNCW3|nr:MAG: hypothetical protein AMJ83_11685 [candidate division WOR_3 bacterium SM23_42]
MLSNLVASIIAYVLIVFGLLLIFIKSFREALIRWQEQIAWYSYPDWRVNIETGRWRRVYKIGAMLFGLLCVGLGLFIILIILG